MFLKPLPTQGKPRNPRLLTLFLTLCLTLTSSLIFSQTIFRNASGQLPPEPVVTDPSQGPNSPTNTADANFIDIEGDGDLDVYIADGTNSVFGRENRLLRNDGAGNFTDISATNLPPSSNTPLGPGPSNSQGSDIGDIDGDGDMDIIVANLGNNELLLNDGNGNFTDASNLLPPPPGGPIAPFDNIGVDAELSDVDGDGDLDVFISNEIPPIPPFGPNGSQNLLYIQQANGTFTDETASRFPLNINTSQNIESFDIDGDGDMDAVEINIGQNRILINDGNGFFTDETASRFPTDPGSSTRGIDFGDIDHDGDIDLIFGNSNNQANQVLINNGNAVFTDETASRLPADIAVSTDANLFDVDYDGDLDLIFANNSLIFVPMAPPVPGPALNALYLNDGNGVFTDAGTSFLPQTVNATFEIEIGDLTGDGLADIFLCNANTTPEELFIRDITPPVPAFRDPDLRPFLICVEDNNDGTHTARFGYRNTSGGPLYMPKSILNSFVNFAFPFDEQPVVFLPGGTDAFPEEVFEVRIFFFTLWSLNGRFAFASFLSQECGADKAPVTFEPERLSIYPNPGIDRVNIEGVNPDDLVEVYDMQGKKVASGFGVKTVEMDHLPNGLYFVRVNTLTVGKWIKQR